MTDETANLVLEHLRHVRGELHEIREEQREQRLRLGMIERGLATSMTEIAQMSLRLDRVHDPIDRIEQRLGLVEA